MTVPLAKPMADLHRQAITLINRSEFVQAHAPLVEVIKQVPDHADSYFLLGVINLALGQVQKASKLVEKALVLDNVAEYQAQLAKIYALLGNMQGALRLVEGAPSALVEQALVADTFGVALSRIGRHQQALEYFSRAIALDNRQPNFYYNYAMALKFVGDFIGAEPAFEQAIELKPDYHQAHYALAELAEVDGQQSRIERLTEMLATQELVKSSAKANPDQQLYLSMALAKECHAFGQYQAAFNAMATGKAAKRAQINYQISDDLAVFDHIEKLAEQFHHQQLDGHPSSEPIFILGMPRSGTTLVDRILSNHSDVESAGELQDFGMAVKELTKTDSNKVLDLDTLTEAYHLDGYELGQRYLQKTRVLTGQHKHFIDKLPFNFFYLDLIRRCLPNAKVICLLRDPLDTCLGNFRQLFSTTNPYYCYSYDILETGRFYAGFYHWLNFYQRHLQRLASSNNHFKLLNYQDLVNNPEREVKQLLSFCQLPFEQKCLHIEQNDAPVATASKVQVRSPINQKSVGRWRHYRKQLTPLMELLGELEVPFSQEQ